MEFIIEFICELLFEGGIELSKSRKVPKIVRYPLIVLIVLIFSVIIFGLLFLGVMILNSNILAGLFIIAVSIFLLISAIKEFKKNYIEIKHNNTGDLDNEKSN